MLLSAILGQGLGGGGKLRYQEFTSSGTFTPSAQLVANGGQCMAMAVGGGAGSLGKASGALTASGGGNAGEVIIRPITITSGVSVAIGAGGGAGVAGGLGSTPGNTSVGSLVALGAQRSFNTDVGGSGACSVGNSMHGGLGIFGFAGGGGPGNGGAKDGGARGTGGGEYVGIAATPNTGGGGGGLAASTHAAINGGAGGSGFVRVWWFE
jgi:hypothetical protein